MKNSTKMRGEEPGKMKWFSRAAKTLMAMAFLASAMVCLPARALAATGTFQDLDGDGKALSWEYDESAKVLVISGTGDLGNQLLSEPFESMAVEKVVFRNCKAIGSMREAFGAYERDGVKITPNISQVKEIDLSDLDTSKVTDMSSMFYHCENLEKLDLRGFDTSNVTDMSGMFEWCFYLRKLDVSSFNTSKVTNMAGMFNQCNYLEELDVSGFDTGNVTNMTRMFQLCEHLTSLNLKGFNTRKVTSMVAMFQDCSWLSSLDLSGFDTGNVTDMWRMFARCWSLTSLDLSKFDTGSVKYIGSMFLGCSSLSSLDLSGFDLRSVEVAPTYSDGGIADVFKYCEKLATLKTPKRIGELPLTVELPGEFTDADGRSTAVLSKEYANTTLTREIEEPTPEPEPEPTPLQPVYRLYNPNSGEHLYTTDTHETRVLAVSGWNYEGIAWFAPQTGVAVYRLYSPVTKAHLYTSDQNEVNVLLAGTAWTMDNAGNPMFYTGDADTSDMVPIYRLYNEQEQMHLLTTDWNEYDVLGGQGWNQEGEKLSCLSLGEPGALLP